MLRAGAAQADGVVSLAFSLNYHTADGLAAAIAEESAARAVLGEALIGSDRPIVTVAGTPWVMGRAATEADPLPLDGPVADRVRSVNALMALASRGVRATSVRLPRTVHNQGRGASPVCWSTRRGVAVWPAILVMEISAGRPCTRSTLHACSGWLSKRRLPGRPGMPLLTGVTWYATLQPSSAGG